MENVKEKKKMKKSVKLTLILAPIAIVLVIIAVVGINFYKNMLSGVGEVIPYQSKEEVYEYFDSESDEGASEVIDKYSSKVESLRNSKNGDDEKIWEALKEAEPLADEEKEIYKEANEAIIKVFKEKYGVSVEEKLAKLEIKKADMRELGPAGCYLSLEGLDPEYLEEAKTFGLNSQTVYIDSQELGWDGAIETYIHETVHYLCTYGGDDSMMILEGITELITGEIVMCMTGEEYNPTSDYEHVFAFAEQMLIADKTLINDLIANDNADQDEFFENRIDSKTYDGMAEDIGEACWLLVGVPRNKKYQIVGQDLVGEYCKHFELTDAEQIEIADNFIVALSDFANN